MSILTGLVVCDKILQVACFLVKLSICQLKPEGLQILFVVMQYLLHCCALLITIYVCVAVVDLLVSTWTSFFADRLAGALAMVSNWIPCALCSHKYPDHNIQQTEHTDWSVLQLLWVNFLVLMYVYETQAVWILWSARNSAADVSF